MMAFLEDSSKLRKFLFFYWLVVPLLFFAYVMMSAQSKGIEFREVLNNATVAIGFLSACMTLILAVMFKGVQGENEQSEKKFALFAAVQQLLVGNLVGALGSYFLMRSLRFAESAPFAPRLRWPLLAGMALLGVLSLFVVLIMFNVAFG